MTKRYNCPDCGRKLPLENNKLKIHSRPSHEGDSPDQRRFKRLICSGSRALALDCAGGPSNRLPSGR